KDRSRMASVFGICALCRNERELRNSHFLPQALYRYVRANTGAVRSPIIIGSDSARNTDRQFTKYLLCHECEQRFSRNGEHWTMKQPAASRTARLVMRKASGVRCAAVVTV